VFTGSPVDEDMWIWCVIPFVGSLFASLFFEIVFKKTVIHLKQKQEKAKGIVQDQTNSDKNSSEEDGISQRSGSSN
jgi:phosphate/sulfate permease